MQSNPFNNLPKINKIEAINILRKPISEVKFLADYYKAVFHLANYPCEESEIILVDFIQHDCEKLEYSTKSKNVVGTIKEFKILSSGYSYKKLPQFNQVISTNGSGANIKVESNDVGRIKKVRIIDKKYINFFNSLVLVKNNAGNIKIVIEIKLNAKSPDFSRI